MAAIEEEDKELEADATKAEPKRSMKKWIIIGIVVLVIGGGGYAAWDFLLAERLPSKPNPQTQETEHSTAEANNEKFGIICEMEPFIVNLLGREGKRYLKTRIEFEVESGDMEKELTQRTPQLRDAILLLLTSKSFEDVCKPEGKLRLKTELITRINQILPGAGIRTLYFTEFVVQ
jgi:flagellar FliL protein